jgi:phage shock protein PspC (stress-responsive transcriptional regulator)
MKETIKINLNQRLFDLDADAYNVLKGYLDSLRHYFDRKPGEADEIMQDIEQRIAEVLTDKLQGGKQVIVLADIEEVIKMMGTPADFDIEEDLNVEEDQKTDDSKNKWDTHRDQRRLYRDLETNIIGGVCSGLAAYFNIDTVWIRLIFVILLFLNGIGAILYGILWAVVPGANTTAQRLQMKGRPVTVENIQESVKSEYEKVKDNLNSYSQSESFKRTRNTFLDILNSFGQILIVFFKVILIIIGVCIGISVVALILTFLGVFSFGNFNTGINFSNHLEPFLGNITLFSIALAAVIIIPAIAILNGIIKLVFNIKSRLPILSAFAWTLWSLALVFVIIALLSGKSIFYESIKQKDKVSLKLKQNKPLYINVKENSFSGWETGHLTLFGRDVVRDKVEDRCYFHPSVAIRSTDQEIASMVIEQSFSFPFSEEFWDNHEYHVWNEFEYKWSQDDTVLILDNYFGIEDERLWQLPGMRITIYLPEGQQIVLDDDIKDLIVDNYSENNSLPDFNTHLVMENDKLSKVKN